MIARSKSRVLQSLSRHSHSRPHSIAVAEIDETGSPCGLCTYAALEEQVTHLATLLESVTNPGDSVVGVMPSGIDAVAWFLAAVAAGVRWVTIDAGIAPGELQSIAQRAKAALAVIIGTDTAAGALAEICPILDQSLVYSSTKGGAAVVRDPGSVLLATSGTTARPKLALRESAALDADADTVIAGLRLTEIDCVLVATPLSHSYGVDMLLATICAGASLHVLRQFEPAALVRQLQTVVTVLPGVPFMFEVLARIVPDRPCGIRLAVSAGAPLPETIQAEFSKVWGLAVGNLYGASELGTVAIRLPEASAAPKAPTGCIGPPIGGARFRIVDSDEPSRICRAHQEGHLAVWAPSMLSCYLDEPVPSIDGYFLTGDIGRMDTSGSVVITGRLKHLIDLGGFKVNPLEIETEILRHPDVGDCAVVGIPASQTRSRLRALIVPRRPDLLITAESLRSFLRPLLSAGKIPRAIELVDSLPRSPTGKLLRAKC